MPSHGKSSARRVDVYIPSALGERLNAFLSSSYAGGIPKGALNTFFVSRTNEFFNTERLWLGSYAGFPPDAVVTGDPSTLRLVAHALASLRTVPEAVDAAFPELNPGADASLS